jgi:16S rRNA (guanine1516-N2)-methyltransferase
LAWLIVDEQLALAAHQIGTPTRSLLRCATTIDFLSSKSRSICQAARSGSGGPLAKAIGWRHDAPPSIMDCTCGLAGDSFLMACLGCRVTAYEREGFLVEMIRDALNRAQRAQREQREDREDRHDPIRLLEIHHGDARMALGAESTTPRPDVIVIDPMFDRRPLKGRSRKQLDLLQQLVAPAEAHDERQLLDAALARARQRVVVKRPIKADALGGGITHSYPGRSIRYDMYRV